MGRDRPSPPPVTRQAEGDLTRQWNRAVDVVCVNPRTVDRIADADPTFEPRCVVVAAVTSVGVTAGRGPGGWTWTPGVGAEQVGELASISTVWDVHRPVPVA